MKISLVTVSFNSEKTISKTIQSIEQQTFKNIEHIIIDGGSTDSTLKVLRGHSMGHRVVISEPDEGIYDAMNKGIFLATGDIIGILNSDDFFANNNVLQSIANCFQDSELDAVYGDVEYFTKDDINTAVRLYSSRYFSPNKLSYGFMPAHPSLYLRRSVYQRFGSFNHAYKIAGDFDFVCRIFKDGLLKSRYLNETFVRMQLGGISTNGIKSLLLINREIMYACKENAIPTSYLKILLRYPIKALEYIYKR